MRFLTRPLRFFGTLYVGRISDIEIHFLLSRYEIQITPTGRRNDRIIETIADLSERLQIATN